MNISVHGWRCIGLAFGMSMYVAFPTSFCKPSGLNQCALEVLAVRILFTVKGVLIKSNLNTGQIAEITASNQWWAIPKGITQ